MPGLNRRLAQDYFARGNALLAMGKAEHAIAAYDSAIALQAADADAHNNRGAALLALRRPSEALASFDAAIAIDPGLTDALINRGAALRELRRLDEALQTFERALALRPDAEELHYCRGLIQRDRGGLREALASFECAVRLRANYGEAHRERGEVLLGLGRRAEALIAFDAALRHAPADPAAHYQRGNALLEAGERLEGALQNLASAERLQPDFAWAVRRQADAWLALQRPEAAAECLTRLLRMHPDFDFAPGALLHAQRCCADWSAGPDADAERVRQAVMAGGRADLPFSFLAVTDSGAAQLQCAQTYVRQRCERAPPRQVDERHRSLGGARHRPWDEPHWPWDEPHRPWDARHRHDRIRLAYVSGDFREHAVSYLLAGVFERHDAAHFETVAISLRPEEPGAMGGRLKQAFGRFIDVSRLSDLETADLMRELEIDIAVDLAGFTAGLRPQIFACRAAPIQVNYLGFPGTMGAPFMDYILADDFVIPAGHEKFYREQVVRLPHCFQVNDDRRVIDARPASRTAAGLPQEALVFCCFNTTCKLNPALFDVWMRLLRQVPHAVLWLLSGGAAARGNLGREAVRRGVDPGRLIFAERVAYPAHLSRLALADLFLDTTPFNAGTTASDALWSGLPVLTCAGEAFAARMAGSLLRTVGLPELITERLDDYEARALRLAHRPQELRSLRERLNANRRSSPLFDTDLFRRHLESAYRHMWRRHEAGAEPATFSVEP